MTYDEEYAAYARRVAEHPPDLAELPVLTAAAFATEAMGCCFTDDPLQLLEAAVECLADEQRIVDILATFFSTDILTRAACITDRLDAEDL